MSHEREITKFAGAGLNAIRPQNIQILIKCLNAKYFPKES